MGEDGKDKVNSEIRDGRCDDWRADADDRTEGEIERGGVP